MWISRGEVRALSDGIRKIIDGEAVELRDNQEGEWSILKNDIHTLAHLRNEQMDSLQKERNEMALALVNISHQIKTPLTSMLIMADLLENAPQEKRTEFLANMKAGLVRMEWFATALLKIAKLDAGAVEFSAERVAFSELARLALEPLQILLEVKEQRVEVENDVELYCDKRWTGEALGNLIKNASEASPVGGVIRVESGVNPVCKWISVTDSGAGIEKSRVYGLFRRFEGSSKGNGVGLPLALAIMRGQGGDIGVDIGGKGKGAVFTLKLSP